MTNKRKLNNVLPLNYFIHKQKVIRLFRNMLKETNKITNKTLNYDIKLQIKNEFNKNKLIKDNLSIKSLISEGYKQYELLKDISGKYVIKPSSSSSSTPTSSSPTSSTSSTPSKVVGKGWPWERSKS